MKIKNDQIYEVWITFEDGRKIKLGNNDAIEIAESGLLVIRHSTRQVSIYPPNSWVRIRFVNPINETGDVLSHQGLGVSMQSP